MPSILFVVGTSIATGAALGAVFFLGLRWTVDRLGRSDHAARLLLLSASIRFGLAIVCMLALARWHPAAAPSALLGFVATRLIVVGRGTRSPEMAREPTIRRPPGGR